jgi:hypothetical protein
VTSGGSSGRAPEEFSCWNWSCIHCESRAAVARGQLGNTKEGERPPLEAVTRELVKIQQTEDSVRVVLNCRPNWR